MTFATADAFARCMTFLRKRLQRRFDLAGAFDVIIHPAARSQVFDDGQRQGGRIDGIDNGQVGIAQVQHNCFGARNLGVVQHEQRVQHVRRVGLDHQTDRAVGEGDETARRVDAEHLDEGLQDFGLKVRGLVFI